MTPGGEDLARGPSAAADAPATLLVAGEALVDLVPLPPGPAGLPRWEARPGGSPFNVAVGCARLGMDVGYVGRLSRDLPGRILHERLVADDVSTAYVVRTDALTEMAVVATDEDGVAEYSFYFEGTAARGTTAADLRVPSHPAALHVGSIALVLEPLATAVEAMVEEHRSHATVSLDPNTRPRLIADLDAYRARLRRQVSSAHVVKVSDEDLAVIEPDADPVGVARRWLDLGPTLVVVTRGPRGAVAVTADDTVEVGGVEVEVVDTVGAGDTFMSAMLAWLADEGALTRLRRQVPGGEALRAMLHDASRAAAVTCSRTGADPPRRDELTAESSP